MNQSFVSLFVSYVCQVYSLENMNDVGISLLFLTQFVIFDTGVYRFHLNIAVRSF